jgi:hypothetical protein
VALVSAVLASAPDLKGIKFMFKVGDRVRGIGGDIKDCEGIIEAIRNYTQVISTS